MSRKWLFAPLAGIFATSLIAQSPVTAPNGAGHVDSTALHSDSAPVTTSVISPRHDALMVAGIIAAMAAVAPFDRRLQHAFQDSSVQQSSALRHTANVFNTAGGVGALATSVALYGIGRLSGHDAIGAIGLHATEAIAVGGGTTTLLKIVAGRQRPYVQSRDADDFAFGRGRNDKYASFPSGHTTAAFAFASSVSADLRDMHSGVARIATPVLYGGATLVGLSRMYTNEHWGSDVVLGAGIGTIAGLKTIAFSRAHPNDWITRHLLPLHARVCVQSVLCN